MAWWCPLVCEPILGLSRQVKIPFKSGIRTMVEHHAPKNNANEPLAEILSQLFRARRFQQIIGMTPPRRVQGYEFSPIKQNPGCKSFPIVLHL